jgi:hypothetical protein
MITFIATSNEEEDLLAHELSDEALEAAGGSEASNFTMAGLHVSYRLRRLNSPPACFSGV